MTRFTRRASIVALLCVLMHLAAWAPRAEGSPGYFRSPALYGKTIVFVTHQLEQARRVGQQTAILIEGRIVESGATSDIFDRPRAQQTRDFLAGRLGDAGPDASLEHDS